MARPTDPKSSVRDILAKLDRSIDQARQKRMESETGRGTPSSSDADNSFDETPQNTPEPRPGQARPLRARPLRSGETTTDPDPGGKWIGKPND